MKLPNKYIKVKQGPTIAVCLYKVPADDGTIYTRRTLTVKRTLRPMLMRHKRHYGRRPFSTCRAGKGGTGFINEKGEAYAVVYM